MAYKPTIQPPPTTGNQDFDLWLKRAIETIQEYMVKDRQLGEGLVYDELDNPAIDTGFLDMHG